MLTNAKDAANEQGSMVTLLLFWGDDSPGPSASCGAVAQPLKFSPAKRRGALNLKKMGYRNVFSLVGGYREWREGETH